MECSTYIEAGCQHCDKCFVAEAEATQFAEEKAYEVFLQQKAEEEYKKIVKLNAEYYGVKFAVK